MDKSNSRILETALHQARNLRYTLEKGGKPLPPQKISSGHEMRALVNLFHSPQVGANDATAMLYELYRILHIMREQSELFLQEFWRGDQSAFAEFVLHNLEWYLHKAGEVATNIREAAAVLHELLPLMRSILNQDTRVVLFQRSLRHFRIQLTTKGYIEESDYLYEAWKAFREEEGEMGDVPNQFNFQSSVRERSRESERNQGLNLNNGIREEPNFGEQTYRRGGRGRGRAGGNSNFLDEARFAPKEFRRGDRRGRGSRGYGGQYRGNRGDRRGNGRGYRTEFARAQMSPENLASSPVQNFVAPAGWNDNPQQPNQQLNQEQGEHRNAEQIFSDHDSMASFPSYQKEVLDINRPSDQNCEWGQEVKEIHDPVAPPTKPGEPEGRKPKHFLNVQQGEQVKEEQNAPFPQISSEEMDELPRPTQEEQIALQEQEQLPQPQEIKQDPLEEEKEQQEEVKGEASVVSSSQLQIESSFYQNLQKEDYKQEDKNISGFIAQTAKCFRLRDNERTFILKKIKHVNMALKIDKIFFKKYPSEVKPFGSFCNGGWTSGHSSINAALLFKDPEHCHQHSLVSYYSEQEQICINLKRVLTRALECKLIQIEWSAGPALLMTITEPASRRSYEFYIAILTYAYVETSNMLFDYSKLDVRCQQLFTFLRKWLDVKAPAGRVQEMCPPYMLELMMVSFLQSRNPPILPNLQTLKKQERILNLKVFQNKEEIMLPLNLYHYTPVIGEERVETLLAEQQGGRVEHNPASAGSLFFEFLHFYLYKFNREKWVVDPAQGGYSTKPEANENVLCVKDPFYSPTPYLLRAGSVDWDALFKAMETTLICFQQKNPILSLDETDKLKEQKKNCWNQ